MRLKLPLWVWLALIFAMPLDVLAFWRALHPHVDATYRAFYIDHTISDKVFAQQRKSSPTQAPPDPRW